MATTSTSSGGGEFQVGAEEERVLNEARSLLNQFQRSLLAIRETQEFVAAGHGNTASTEEHFVWVANRELPGRPEGVLRSVAHFVHSKIHERMDLLTRLEEQKAANSVKHAEVERWNDSLREGIAEITGDVEDYYRFDKVWALTAQGSSREKVLLNSLFTTAVSEFEALMAGLIRLFLSARPEILKSSGKKFSYRDIEGYSSISEFRDAVRESVADEVLRGGFDAWMDWLDRERNLGIPEVTTQNADLSEIFQRRHLLVHNSGIVNRYYLERVVGDRLPLIGARLRVGAGYLSGALDHMTIAGIKIGIAVARKVLKEQACLDEIDHYLSHVTYDQMTDGRYVVAHEIGILQSVSARSDEVRLIGQVNAWLSLKEISGAEQIVSEVENWDVSTLASRFKLAKLSLLGRDSEAYEVAKKLIEVGELHASEWMTWPLLASVRSFEEEMVPAVDRIRTPAFDSPHIESADLR